MRKPPSTTIARPANALMRVPRSRMEAATELVRLEFDAARLERELNLLGRRAQTSTVALERTRSRITQALDRLARPEGK